MAPLYKRYVPPKVGEAHAAPVSAPVAVSQGLYKRYIPPKTTSEAPTSTVPAAVTVREDAGEGEGGPKRKRERGEDEVAERKAKKMRKKAVEPVKVSKKKGAKPVSQPEESQPPTVVKEVVNVNAELEANAEQKANAEREANGDFGHIKNVKKRHKLEKEARKARKAAEKVGGGEDGQKQDEVAVPKEDSKPDESVVEVSADVQADAEEADQAVPAKKLKKKRKQDDEHREVEQVKTHDDVSASSAGLEAESTTKKDKKKRSRKSEESHESQVEQTEQPAEDVAEKGQEPQIEHTKTTNDDVMDIDVQAPTAPDSATAKLKKRRHRLEAVLAQTNGDTEIAAADADVEDDHLRKHGTVLSKFQKATKTAPTTAEESDDQPAEEPLVLHDLVPLPQLEKAPTPDFVPQLSALPPWLAKPTVISNDSKATFSSLGLESSTVEHLNSLNFTDALPVQQALIPLLLPPGVPGASFFPGTEPVLPDLAVSAATGSGKTIAYLLPVIEALKRKGCGDGTLKAVVVVPTRELVAQVTGVAESLAKGSKLRIGTAVGSGKLRTEQEKLVRKGSKYDPEGHAKLIKVLERKDRSLGHNDDDSDIEDENETIGDEAVDEDPREHQRIADADDLQKDFVPVYSSPIDILICTPGRLLEHLNSTLGFSLSFLQYLVLDEADKLLDQQYDGFLEHVNAVLTTERSVDEQNDSEVILRQKGWWNESRERRVRKIVLSATMTADVSKLAGLRLFRPRMVVVRGSDADEQPQATPGAEGVRNVGEGFELPPTLVEFCVPVGEGGEKALVLVKLLEERILTSLPKSEKLLTTMKGSDDEDDDSDVESVESSVLSSSSEEPSSDEDSDDEDSDDEDDDSDDTSDDSVDDAPANEDTGVHPDRAALFAPKPKHTGFTGIPTILIFTSTTESAARLAHLLKFLKPDWSPYIALLNKTSGGQTKAPSSTNGQPSITVSTDRSARGLDSLQSGRAITHVVQYDVPRSLTAYIHRVGRTARAGKQGEAWTLYEHREARWFLREVCGVVPTSKDDRRGVVEGAKVKVGRAGQVEKVGVEVEEGMRGRYEEGLLAMRDVVMGGGKGKARKDGE